MRGRPKSERAFARGRIRPGDPRALGADEQGRTRPKRLFVIEFVLGPFAELEILARGKPSDALGADDTDPVAAQPEMEAAD